MGSIGTCCCCPITAEDLPNFVVIGDFIERFGEYWKAFGFDTRCCFFRDFGHGENTTNPERYVVTQPLHYVKDIKSTTKELIAWERPARKKICTIGGNYYQPWPVLHDGPTEAQAKATCPQSPLTAILDYSCLRNRKVLGRSTKTEGVDYKMRLEMAYRVLGIRIITTKVRLSGGLYIGEDGEVHTDGPETISEWFAISIDVTVRYFLGTGLAHKVLDVRTHENLATDCYDGESSTVDNSTGQNYFSPPSIPVPIIPDAGNPPIPFNEEILRKVKFYSEFPTEIDFDAMTTISQASYAILSSIHPDCFNPLTPPKTAICVLYAGEDIYSEPQCDEFQIVTKQKDFVINSGNATSGTFLHSQGGTFREDIFVSCNNTEVAVGGQKVSWSHFVNFPALACNSIADYSYNELNPIGWGPSHTVSIFEKYPYPSECLITEPCSFPVSGLYTFPQSGGTFFPPFFGRYYVGTAYHTTWFCNPDYTGSCDFLPKNIFTQPHVVSASNTCDFFPLYPTEVCITQAMIPLIQCFDSYL